MEDIIGIEVKDGIKGYCAFLTWGRIFARVESKELLDVIAKYFSRYGID